MSSNKLAWTMRPNSPTASNEKGNMIVMSVVQGVSDSENVLMHERSYNLVGQGQHADVRKVLDANMEDAEKSPFADTRTP
jgi:hypothetical protein